MYELVNPSHPDKCADRIAGAIVDLAYSIQPTPRIAVEVLLGHRKCHIIVESSVALKSEYIESIVHRIVGQECFVNYTEVAQDARLANNQRGIYRCGDNGIFRGMPVTEEQRKLAQIARDIYSKYPYDGKYILDGDKLIICQSHARTEDLKKDYPDAIINPIGDWTGGYTVDTGAVNRKLGSDMGDSVTGGGLWGKDLSKADVSVNIYAWLKAQATGKPVEISCAIGDEIVDGRRYGEIVQIAATFIGKCGGFEKFAEWGLIAGMVSTKQIKLGDDIKWLNEIVKTSDTVKNCNDCSYFAHEGITDGNICLNGESECYGDWVDGDGSCEKWQAVK